MLPLNYQSNDSWREKALSWLKIFRMVSNKQTAEKSHWLKKKKSTGEGLILSPAASSPALGFQPPGFQEGQKASWTKEGAPPSPHSYAGGRYNSTRTSKDAQGWE